MKKLFVAACCLFLTGCAAGSTWSGSSGIDPMQSDGLTYVPGPSGGYEPPPDEERLTTTCTMKGKGVQCY